MSWPFGKSGSILGSDDPGAIYLGRYWNAEKRRAEGKLQYGGERHITVLGPNGSGKGARLLIPNLLQIEGKSLIVMDPKGQNAAVTAEWRRKVSNVVILNPFGLHTSIYPDLKSAGFNSLISLFGNEETFFDNATGIAEALIRIEGNDPHWPESAQALVLAFILWEMLCAEREKRTPSLARVRALMTAPDIRRADASGRSKLVSGLRITADKMSREGGPLIRSLIGRFTRGHDEIASIQSSADTQTRWVLSAPMAADMCRNEFQFGSMKDQPTTVYVILPAEYMETHSAWLRLVMTVALRALYRPGGTPVLFMLDEFAHLGRLRPIETALGLARGYRVQMMPVLQSLTQLKTLYKENYQNFLGQSGAVVGLTPNDEPTAEWMSRHSGETTIRQPTVNTNQNAGGAGSSMGEGYGRRPYLMPQNLYGMREGFGFIWAANQSRPIPTYMPPYWHVEKWAKRARPDPYHLGEAA